MDDAEKKAILDKVLADVERVHWENVARQAALQVYANGDWNVEDLKAALMKETVAKKVRVR